MRPYYEDMSGRLSSVHNDWPLSFFVFLRVTPYQWFHFKSLCTLAHICTLSKVRCGIKRMQSAFKSLNFKIFVSLLAITVLYFLFHKFQCFWCYFEHTRILLFSPVCNFCSSQLLEWHEQTGVLLNLNDKMNLKFTIENYLCITEIFI